MKHGANTYNHQAVHAGTFNYKQTKIQNLNAPPAFKSAEYSSQAAPPHIYR